MAPRLFRRRGTVVEVRMNDEGRAFVRGVFEQVVASERDPEHVWHIGLVAPIDPTRDADDPLAVLRRQTDTMSNAELALASVTADSLTLAEAWAWFSTLQVGLRSVAAQAGIHTDQQWAEFAGPARETIEGLQIIQGNLADSL